MFLKTVYCCYLDQSLKPITIKICKKGSFQLTGCLSMESGEFCVLSLITNLQKKNPRWIPSLISYDDN